MELTEEGYYGTYGKVGARTEVPGCSLCMGNQARTADNATVVSTSTRNFPNRMGAGANVFLASAELAAVCSVLGRIPSVEEYMRYMHDLETQAEDTYRYMNFDRMPDYRKQAEKVALAE
jgi:aconitate hydratase 2/2-methylisocitrate dehydratase